MKILVGKTFGIGNAIMAVPMLKALKSMGHQIDVLVGTLPDDGGAKEVMTLLQGYLGVIDKVWLNAADDHYDLAIMSIPFDGRWKNNVHFSAAKVVDGRTRPDPSTTGLISWKKHEVEYQMDNASELGYKGQVPSMEFMSPHAFQDPYSVYLGIGYKKDAAGFWKVKHWGNENYAELVKRLLAEHPLTKVYTTGDVADLQMSITPIRAMVKDSRFIYVPGNLQKSFDVVNDCATYVGNDTGMMHVAAARHCKVVGIFMMQRSAIKARPWCDTYSCIDAHVAPNGFTDLENPRNVSVEEVFEEVLDVAGSR